MTSRNRNLDALRAVAVLMVLGRHFDYPFYPKYWIQVGWAGVDLFFVLSGFLVSGILFVEYQKYSQLKLARFYLRRGLKIWPAFYTMTAVSLLVLAFKAGPPIAPRQLLAELFFLQSYIPGLWGITWSLAVEEHFYLLLPPVLLLVRGKRERPFAVLPYLFIGVAVVALACRFAAGWNDFGNTDYQHFLYPTHLRIDGLMFGVLLSYYKHFHPHVFRKIAEWRGGWVAIAASIAILSMFPVEGRHMHTWGLTTNYLGAGLLLAKAVAFEGPKPIRFITRYMARIGLYSYSIYLWHAFVRLNLLPYLPIPSQPLRLFGYVVGCILLGTAAAKLVEFPVLKVRDRLLPSSAEREAANMLVEATA